MQAAIAGYETQQRELQEEADGLRSALDSLQQEHQNLVNQQTSSAANGTMPAPRYDLPSLQHPGNLHRHLLDGRCNPADLHVSIWRQIASKVPPKQAFQIPVSLVSICCVKAACGDAEPGAQCFCKQH